MLTTFPQFTSWALTFVGSLCIPSQSVSKDLQLRDSFFSDRAFLRNTHFDYDAVFDGSHFSKDLDLAGASIGGNLSLRSVYVSGDLNLRHARIDQDLYFGADTNEERSVVGGNFIANSAVIKGQFGADFAVFKQKTDMQFLSVGEDLTFRHGAEFNKRIDLRSSHIAGRLTFSAAHIASDLDLTNAFIGDSLIFCAMQAQKTITLRNTKVGNDLDLRGMYVKSGVMARGLNVTGDLQFDFGESNDKCDNYLSSSGVEKSSNGTRNLQSHTAIDRMNLTDAKAQIFFESTTERQLRKEDLPTLEMDGFIFSDLKDSGADSSIDYYLSWLAQDKTFTPQPYQHLATLLRAHGQDSEANEILFRSRQRERVEACKNGPSARCVGLWLLEVTIGYGIGTAYFRVLYWIIGLSVVGGLIGWWCQKRMDRKKLWWACMASFDYIVPLIELDKAHKDFIMELENGPKLIFFAFALAGWALASFVIAAMAGLTQGA